MGLSELHQATDSAIAFLAERQLPSGQFATYMGQLGTASVLEPSPFGTSLVVQCLEASSDPRAREMRERAGRFLSSEMERRAVWRHWLRDDPRYHSIPPDLDDTACVSRALEQLGVPFPDNRVILLGNRDRAGRFYTWITPRLRSIPTERTLWQVAAHRWRRPLRSFGFWRHFDATRYDVDGVVNANVLLYLGDAPEADAVGAYLSDTLIHGEEAWCDKWYQSKMVFYYAVSRCVRSGIRSLQGVRQLVIDCVGEHVNLDGSVGAHALDTGLAVTTLRNCGVDYGTDRAVDWLLASQLNSGAWPIAPLYYSGPRREAAFGSEELTTAFCIEALLNGARTSPIDERARSML